MDFYKINNGLSFNVVDAESGYGLNGATFELRQNNILVRKTTSKLGGTVKFKIVFPGYYRLIQTSSPAGYIKDNNIYTIYIDNNYISINGKCCNFVIKNKKENLKEQ